MLRSTATQTCFEHQSYNEDYDSMMVEDNFKIVTLSKNSTIDPSDMKVCKVLREWCKIQWTRTFQKNLANCNAIYYHECCFSFSRRGFKKQAGHPELQTSSVLKIPTFKEIETSEGLFKWLFNRLETAQSRGQKCYFPSINRFHSEDDDSDHNEEDNLEQVNFLRKRIDLLQQENHRVKKSLEAANIENKSLLASSKNWYNRYEILNEKQGEQMYTLFETPRKIIKEYEGPTENLTN